MNSEVEALKGDLDVSSSRKVAQEVTKQATRSVQSGMSNGSDTKPTTESEKHLVVYITASR